MFAGSLAGATSPARVFSPVVGAQIHALREAHSAVPLLPDHEHVLFAARGPALADGVALGPGALLYLGTGRDSVTLTGQAGTRLFLLGGEPMRETLLMWWNFA